MDAEAILHNKLWYNLGSNWMIQRIDMYLMIGELSWKCIKCILC